MKYRPRAIFAARGEGEEAVQAAFPGAVIIRPAVMFASDESFLTTIHRLLRVLPIYPLLGDGRTGDCACPATKRIAKSYRADDADD